MRHTDVQGSEAGWWGALRGSSRSPLGRPGPYRRLVASCLLLAGLVAAVPAQAQTTNTIWSWSVQLTGHKDEGSIPGYGPNYANSILLRDEFVYDHTTLVTPYLIDTVRSGRPPCLWHNL